MKNRGARQSPMRVATAALAALLTGPPRAPAQPAGADVVGPPSPVESATSADSAAPSLVDRAPFDRVTFNAANGGSVVECEPLDLPDRGPRLQPPASGVLTMRRVSDPSVLYEADWSTIDKIEFYEGMILAEAEELTAAGEFAAAFARLAFLQRNYPQLPDLDQACQRHLWREASSLYAAGRREEAWAPLLALAELNPRYPRLINAVEAVSNDVISRRMQAREYAAARRTIEAFEQGFAAVRPTNLRMWKSRFDEAATQRVALASQALAAGDLERARQAARQALDVVPEFAPARELLRQIQRQSPEVRVGVFELSASSPTGSAGYDWAAVRGAPLTAPTLAELVDFGAEGGEYRSVFVDLSGGPGEETTVRPAPAMWAQGLSAPRLAVGLAAVADRRSGPRTASFAASLAAVEVRDPRAATLRWRKSRIRPEALLSIPLPDVAAEAGLSIQVGYSVQALDEAVRYRRRDAASPGGPEAIIEQLVSDDEAAVAALVRGELDALDRVPPWLVDRLSKSSEVVVGEYRLPTVHVLVPNFARPLTGLRDFRRALGYGIDRAAIVQRSLLGGQPRAGFQPLCGPFLRGQTLNDPVGYGSDPQLEPWPFNPSLAGALVALSRGLWEKQQSRAVGSEDDGAAKPAAPGTAAAPLTLAHGADPVAQLACQLIREQLALSGVALTLVELHGPDDPRGADADLRYLELASWEPLVDARGLLGPGGLAAGGGPLLADALIQLDEAETWSDARGQLKAIHALVRHDLPLIPLWQTANYFAVRRELSGVGERPPTLYHNVAAWRKGE